MADQGSKPPGLPVVLLVDDEEALIDSISRVLKDSFELHTAATTAEAEELLAQRRFDVIVCDHMLPGEQGMDFLVRMMETLPSMRRILITGYMNAEFISRCTVIAGLSVCLVKPVRASVIADAIRAALAS